MTTPELPYITGGTIWDGVTQYHFDYPPGLHKCLALPHVHGRHQAFQ